MNTTEQAREVEKRLRYGMYMDGRDLQAADTIDVLIADLEMMTSCYKTADRIAKDALAELAALKQQEPYKMEAVFDAASQRHKNAPLYLAAGAQSVPWGYQLVPVEPTEAMVVNCVAAGGCFMTAGSFKDFTRAYKAMLAAAPVQTATQPLPECELNNSFAATTEGWVKQEHIGQIPFGWWIVHSEKYTLKMWPAKEDVLQKLTAPACVSKTADPDTQADLTIKPNAQERKPLTDVQINMLNFLYGAGELDGVWFGERHPTAKGAFWWRKHLRRVFDDDIKEGS